MDIQVNNMLLTYKIDSRAEVIALSLHDLCNINPQPNIHHAV